MLKHQKILCKLKFLSIHRNSIKLLLGFSLIELLLVLAIIAILLSSVVFVTYRKVQVNRKITATQIDLEAIVSAAHVWRTASSNSDYGTYNDISLAKLCENNLLTNYLCETDSNGDYSGSGNPWGGEYSFKDVASNNFIVVIDNVTKYTGVLADILKENSLNNSSSEPCSSGNSSSDDSYDAVCVTYD
mgnify:CR=1 FL=1